MILLMCMSIHYPDYEFTLLFQQFSNGQAFSNLVIFVQEMKIPSALSSMQQFCFIKIKLRIIEISNKAFSKDF